MPISVLSDGELRKITDESALKAAQIVIDRQLPSADASWTWMPNSEYLVKRGVTKTTAQRDRDNGVIPYSKIGGKIYYRRSDVEALLEKNLRIGGAAEGSNGSEQ